MSLLPLRTPRLVLRDYRLADFAAACTYACDPEVSLHSTWGPNDEAQTQAWLESAIEGARQKPRPDYELAIEFQGHVIGTAHLGLIDPANRGGVLGYTLRRSAWGQGLATEAARALLELGFGSLGLHRIHATASPLNLASHRVLEKLGMRREALLVKNVLQRGRWRDSVVYALLEEELSPGG
jgi:RimJ/RimL family protein N-acetyltransferase